MIFSFLLLISGINLFLNKVVFSYFLFFILLAMACFRSKELAIDAINYYNYGVILKEKSLSEIFKVDIWIEKGYLIYTKVIMYMNEPYLILILSSLITIIGIHIFIKKNSSNYILSFFLFQGLMFYYDSLNIIRQYLAIVICLMSFNFILERKKGKFYFSILLASFFHKTALIFLPLYILYKIKLTKKKIKTLVIITIVVYFNLELLFDIFSRILPSYSGYLLGNKYKDFNLGNRIFFIRDCLVFYLLYKKQYYKNNFENICMWIALMAFSIGLYSIKLGILNRVQLYYTIFYIILIPNYISMFSKKENQKIIKILLLMIIIVYHTSILILRSEWYNVCPYKIFLFE